MRQLPKTAPVSTMMKRFETPIYKTFVDISRNLDTFSSSEGCTIYFKDVAQITISLVSNEASSRDEKQTQSLFVGLQHRMNNATCLLFVYWKNIVT